MTESEMRAAALRQIDAVRKFMGDPANYPPMATELWNLLHAVAASCPRTRRPGGAVMTDTTVPGTDLDAAAARVSALWREYRSGPVPTRLDEMMERYEGGAAGYVLDLELLARDWITSRASQEAGASSPLSSAALPGP